MSCVAEYIEDMAADVSKIRNGERKLTRGNSGTRGACRERVDRSDVLDVVVSQKRMTNLFVLPAIAYVEKVLKRVV